jgi:hypothetical protein
MKTQKRKSRKNKKTRKGGVGSSSSNTRNLKAATRAAKKEYERAKWCGDRTKAELKKEYDNIRFKAFNRKKIKTLEGCYKDILKKEEMELAQGLINEAKAKRVNIEQLEEDPVYKKSTSIKSPGRSQSMKIASAKGTKGSFEKVSPPKKREENLKAKLNKSMKEIENPQKRFTTEYGKEFNYLYGKEPGKRKNSSGYDKLKRSSIEEPISLRLKDPESEKTRSSYLNLSTDSSIDLDPFEPAK